MIKRTTVSMFMRFYDYDLRRFYHYDYNENEDENQK